MAGEDSKSFWTTLPGILTGIAAVITAIGGFLLICNTLGWFDGEDNLSPPKIELFDVNPKEINSGDNATLIWSVSDATSVTITPDIGSVPLSETITIHPTQTTTYTILATNKAGSVNKSTSVKVLSAESKTMSLGVNVPMDFVLIHVGDYRMGSSFNKEETPAHEVMIGNAFYLGKYEVTQQTWREVMGIHPSRFTGDDRPVEQVSWNDVQEFIKRLNKMEGTDKYRLPSEAEWEYACRAGTTTRYSFGDDESKLNEYAWYNQNSGGATHSCGQKNPNPWGLYDMYGNVCEWVQDEPHDNYSGAPSNGSAWEGGNGSYRIVRGGSWEYNAWRCRSSSRRYLHSDYHFSNVGFRLLKEL